MYYLEVSLAELHMKQCLIPKENIIGSIGFRPTIMDRLNRLEAVYHTEGLLRTLKSAIVILVSFFIDYRTCIKVVWETDSTIRAFPWKKLLIRQAGMEDLPQLKKIPEALAPEKRLRRGHVCFVALDGDRIVGATWYSPENNYSYALHMWIHLSEGEVCACGTYIIQEYRNKGLLPVFLVNMAKHMQKQGYKRRITLVSEKNAAMRTVTSKMVQARETERITVWKIFR
jgi:hypothetical protein